MIADIADRDKTDPWKRRPLTDDGDDANGET